MAYKVYRFVRIDWAAADRMTNELADALDSIDAKSGEAHAVVESVQATEDDVLVLVSYTVSE